MCGVREGVCGVREGVCEVCGKGCAHTCMYNARRHHGVCICNVCVCVCVCG